MCAFACAPKSDGRKGKNMKNMPMTGELERQRRSVTYESVSLISHWHSKSSYEY